MPYIPFHSKFPDIAENETRSLIVLADPDLPDDRYIFTEAYCDENNCDCRRVFFNVFSDKTKKLLAVITFGWEKREYYIEWMGNNDPNVIDTLAGLGLNLASSQSDLAPFLLKKIDLVLKNDKNYVNRLKNHYKIFKKHVEKNVKKEKIYPGLKVGRNDLCPCGSGKKYKTCCLN
ncbi:MAG TPA: hypothetical protein ENG83_14620 [Nitrospirae bacterium]|nr:hypothetical protein BMS3Abin06_01624 [bacterium BMS3Abin06]HDH13404.1 hypothetical protein [Nitrospirota bacterium]HDZ02181.1 hypothetical protein [Nitrospirota bacterium]